MIEKYKPFFTPQPHYSYELFIEGVIRPESYITDIKEHFIKSYSENTNIIELLNNAGKKYKISFEYEKYKQAPDDIFFVEGWFESQSDNIIISVNYSAIERVSLNSEMLSKDSFIYLINNSNFRELIGHELLHRLQKANKNIEYSKEIKDLNQYLSNIDEIMSYAWQIVEWYRLEGNSDIRIRKIIQNADLEERRKTPLYHYYKVFKSNRNVLNKLYKYIYMYLDEEIK